MYLLLCCIPLSQPTPPRRLCRVKSFGCETKEEEGKEQLREQKTIEVGRQQRDKGECSPRDARELLRAKMGERDHTGEATGTSRLSCLNSKHQSQCEEPGACPSGKHKHSDSLVAKPEELLSCGFPSPVSGSKYRCVQPCLIAGGCKWPEAVSSCWLSRRQGEVCQSIPTEQVSTPEHLPALFPSRSTEPAVPLDSAVPASPFPS